MQTPSNTPVESSSHAATLSSALSRLCILVYGVFSYAVGVAGLACIIAATAQWLPFGFLGARLSTSPLLLNLSLVIAWGAIHSIMARNSFKAALTRFIPEPAERPTYVLVAGVTSVLMIGLWQPMTGMAWSVNHQATAKLLWAGWAFGWVYLLAATFAINHFDLFGLRQVWLNFKVQPRLPLRFVKTAMYGFSRHPIQTGVLIGIWVTPLMSVTQLALSVGLTAYLFIGLFFEERDLVRSIGQAYVEYRREAGMFLPRLRFRKHAAKAARSPQ